MVAFAFALQGYGIALYRGSPQPWWASFGYALAIFSVWAVLTPAIVVGTFWAGRLTTGLRLLVLTLGLPVAATLHVALFALVFWPIYNDGERIPTRREMAERMALPNLDTNSLFYALLVGGTLWHTTRNRRAPTPALPHHEPARLRVTSRGRLRLIAPADIDWAAAAGDYVELHTGSDVTLVEMTLVALEKLLPPGEFARIHRSALVRLERIAEVRGLGRGDALVRLVDGTELRLSRRYRSNLTAFLRPQDATGPAHRLDRSRPPNGSGGVS